MIDVIVSVHKPQDVETKRLPFAEAADGALGIESHAEIEGALEATAYDADRVIAYFETVASAAASRGVSSPPPGRRRPGTGTRGELSAPRAFCTAYSRSTACAELRILPGGFLRSTYGARGLAEEETPRTQSTLYVGSVKHVRKVRAFEHGLAWRA